MARPTVPKFGDWGTNDQNFTLLFENARAEKGTQRVDQVSSSCNSSFEQDSKDTSVELEKASSDRKLHGASPSPSLLLNRLSNRVEKGTKRVNPISSSSTSSCSEQDGKATSVELGDSSFDRKSLGSSASASPRLNRLSNRAYNQRDYEYIATFPRRLNGRFRANKYQGSHEDSDASTSSPSTSFFDDISVNSSGSRKQEEYQQRFIAQTRSDVPDSPGRVQISEGRSESEGRSKENKRPPLSSLHNQANQGRQGREASVPSPARQMAGEAGAQGKFQGTRASTGPDPTQKPATLPKFGDWNPEQPYTAIFDQHRKVKVTGQTLQASPLQPQTAEKTEPAAPQQKLRLKWGLCCKDSAVED